VSLPSVFRNISPRKLVLALVLLGAILFCGVILLAGAVAVVHEAAPRQGGGTLYGTLAAVKRIIIHHIIPHHRR
jgi:hypothetical protein